jgi:hypothetical protein
MFHTDTEDGQYSEYLYSILQLIFPYSICSGMYFANQILLISMATMLWALDIKPPTDENGTPIPQNDIKWEDNGIIVCVPMLFEFIKHRLVCCCRRPAHFDCQFSPRFAGVQDMLSAAYADD